MGLPEFWIRHHRRSFFWWWRFRDAMVALRRGHD